MYEVVLWPIAFGMVYLIALTIKWAVNSQRLLDASLVFFVLLMMAAMFAGVVIYFSAPGTGTLLIAAWLNLGLMSVGLIPVFVTFLSDIEKGNQRFAPLRNRRMFHVSVIALALINEFLMGWGFNLVSVGRFSLSLGYLSDIVSSYWFVVPMSLEMLLASLMLRKELNSPFLILFVFQSVLMFISPPITADRTWISSTIYAGAALMTIFYVGIYHFLYRNKQVSVAVSNYMLVLLAIYSIMMAGLLFWQLYGSTAVFSFSILFEMVLYFSTMLSHRDFGGRGRISWMSSPWFAFGFIALTFVGEFFMGAFLDVQVFGPRFVALMGLVPLNGNPLHAFAGALYDFVSFFSSVTLSSWFLVMMGMEMGALAAMRIREVREFETKVRLVLMILAYALYSVFFPYFVIPSGELERLPLIGWSMGVGTAGAVAPALIGVIVGTYALSGILSFLFGSRQLCSVLCTAALMYQGTFYDSLKVYNRRSRFARRFLTSKMSSAYKHIAAAVWLSLLGTAVISYLNSVGVLRLTVFGSDPAYFTYAVYFGVLWYLVFISIPFVGTYGCVTTGMCGWGSFNHLLSRAGFWKLTVKDSDLCVKCTTKDCALACPVSNTDMPGQFIAKGEFKSPKCIGVGDCVSACPYGNIKFYDVRNWFRSRLASKSVRSIGVARLTREAESRSQTDTG